MKIVQILKQVGRREKESFARRLCTYACTYVNACTYMLSKHKCVHIRVRIRLCTTACTHACVYTYVAAHVASAPTYWVLATLEHKQMC